MDGAIYLKDGATLTEMTAESYEYERALQEMLADYPRLLAGDAIREDQPLRWLLVAREASECVSCSSPTRFRAN